MLGYERLFGSTQAQLFVIEPPFDLTFHAKPQVVTVLLAVQHQEARIAKPRPQVSMQAAVFGQTPRHGRKHATGCNGEFANARAEPPRDTMSATRTISATIAASSHSARIAIDSSCSAVYVSRMRASL